MPEKGAGKSRADYEGIAREQDRVLNKLAKWRAHFAGWQLGTRPREDPEAQAVRDHRETTLMLRVEFNAMARALCEMVPGFNDKFQRLIIEEAKLYDESLERKFPGVKATENGLSYSQEAAEHMRGWKP